LTLEMRTKRQKGAGTITTDEVDQNQD
jgi:hypothetical protein